MNPVLVAQILDPKQNNFNLLRLLAAAAVVISHAVFLRSAARPTRYSRASTTMISAPTRLMFSSFCPG